MSAPAAIAFSHVTGILDAAVSNHGDAVLHGHSGNVGNRRNLRYAGAGHNPRRADGCRSHADFERVGAGLDEVFRRGCRGNVTGDYRHVEERLELTQRLDDSRGVTVGAIQHQHVNPGRHRLLGALDALHVRAYRHAYAQASFLVFCRKRKLDLLCDVLNRNQSLEHKVVVYYRHLLDAVAAQDVFGLFQRGADRNRNEALFGHHV